MKKKSKHELESNKWKFNNFIGREFEKFKADEVYFFKKEIKPAYVINEPFKYPKKNGDLFEKPKFLIN